MPGRRFSGRKRVAFIGLTLLLSYLACEALAIVGLAMTGDDYFAADTYNGLKNLAEGAGVSSGASEAIHPFLGWVHNPQVSEPTEIFGRAIPVNELGFQDTNHAVQKRGSDRFLLAIAGGSVAWQMSIAGEETLRKKLESHVALKGRRLEIVRLATSGYKQPQQLMALNYVQTLGGEFDAVVNVDGYNEVALAIAENTDAGTAMAYPRAWHARVIEAMDPRSFAAASQLLHLRASRQLMAQHFQNSWFRGSPMRVLWWRFRDSQAKRAMVEFGFEVSRQRKGSFLNHGPQEEFADRDAICTAAVDLWQRSSDQMNRVCNANNALYLHVLQPNLYLSESKPTLSSHEQEFCYGPEMITSAIATETYPLLRSRAEQLEQLGVRFSDQTMLFADISDTIYVDPYCHYNARGNEMLATSVAEELLEMLDNWQPREIHRP